MYILVQGHPSASELSGHHRTPSSGQGTKEQASEMKSLPDIFLPAGEPGHLQGRTVTGKQDRTMRISSPHPAGSQLSSPETASTGAGAACTGRFSPGSRDCPSRRLGILFPTAGNGVPNRSGTVFPISGDAAPLPGVLEDGAVPSQAPAISLFGSPVPFRRLNFMYPAPRTARIRMAMAM